MPIYAVYMGEGERRGVSQLIQTDLYTIDQADLASRVKMWGIGATMELVGEFWAGDWEEAKVAYEAIMWGNP